MTDDPTERPPLTSNGVPVTDEMLTRLAEKAEAGFDLDRLRPRPQGRPLSGPSGVRSGRRSRTLPSPAGRSH